MRLKRGSDGEPRHSGFLRRANMDRMLAVTMEGPGTLTRSELEQAMLSGSRPVAKQEARERLRQRPRDPHRPTERGRAATGSSERLDATA